jgi:hypothetical protein
MIGWLAYAIALTALGMAVSILPFKFAAWLGRKQRWYDRLAYHEWCFLVAIVGGLAIDWLK